MMILDLQKHHLLIKLLNLNENIELNNTVFCSKCLGELMDNSPLYDMFIHLLVKYFMKDQVFDVMDLKSYYNKEDYILFIDLLYNELANRQLLEINDLKRWYKEKIR